VSLLKLLFVVPFGTVTLIMLIEVIEWLITGGEPEPHLIEPKGSSDMEVRHSIEDVEDKDQDTTHPGAGGGSR
jgi:hypothetical protein